MRRQQNIVEHNLGYAVWIPGSTPEGQQVTIQVIDRTGTHVMHAESPDQSALYFEVTAYDTILEHPALVQQQQDFLRQESADGAITPPTQQPLGPHTATTFRFRGTLQGRWKERNFLFIDSPSRTFRIVYDPTSTLNKRVLDTLTLL